MIPSIKGTRDILPPESDLFLEVEALAREVLQLYRFSEIRTPIFERTELFSRSVGEATDIVSKEMYTFSDRDDTSLTLRPEATASVVRAYVAHRLWERASVTRLYYIGPMFRRERPQKGRYRQFSQIGAEVLGSPLPQVDYEVLEMLCTLLERARITGWELLLNSVGCSADRPQYLAALRAKLEPVLPSLCGDCQRRAVTNPMRVLDCKVEEDQPIIAQLPTLDAYLCTECRAHFAEVQCLLRGGGVPFTLAPRLVRGLDYYTRTAFEFVQSSLGGQNALLGGGRYDGLVEALGGPKAAGAGIGFAIGEDRFVIALQAAREAAGVLPGGSAAFIAVPGVEQQAAALALARELRAAGLACEVGEAGRKLGRQMELAARSQARWALILGETELNLGVVQVKRLADGVQQTIPRSALIATLEAEARETAAAANLKSAGRL